MRYGYGLASLGTVWHHPKMGGSTLILEHGIGKVRTSKLQSIMTEKELELMKSIKRFFDPNGILNPETKILN
jgi:FAD/FMN-containing dehydrogenase